MIDAWIAFPHIHLYEIAALGVPLFIVPLREYLTLAGNACALEVTEFRIKKPLQRSNHKVIANLLLDALHAD